MMRVIIDTNSIISALIKDSSSRKIIIESGIEFYAPEEIIIEIYKHKDLILKKSDLTKKDFGILFKKLLEYIKIVPNFEVLNKEKEARNIMDHIDKNDTVFIACALCLENDGIWSDDKHFEKQRRIKIWKTDDLIRLISKNKF